MKKIIIHITLMMFVLATNAQTSNLKYYLKKAVKNSPLINNSKNSLKIIHLDMKKVKSILLKPTVDIRASALLAPIISHDKDNNQLQLASEGVNSYNGYALDYSNGGQYQAVLSVQQPIFRKNTYKAYAKQATIKSKINENNINLTKHELEQLVTHQYILCLLAQRQADVSNSLLNNLSKQLKTMKNLVENAIYKQTDLQIMKIEISNYKIEYQRYISKYKRAFSDLNLLCGINSTDITKLQKVSFDLHPNTTLSKFLKKFELNRMDVQTQQKLFEQKYKPKLNLFADTGLNAVYMPSFNRLGFSVGFSLTWNLFDGKQKKIEQTKSQIEIQNIEFEKHNFINKYQVNKQKYLTQIRTTTKQIEIVQNQLKQYNQLQKMYAYKLSQAQVSIMDFKNLIRDISAKKQENLQLQMQKQILINLYNYWNF